MSSKMGRTIIAKNGASLFSKKARACRTVLIMSSGSYSGLAMHELVHRYWKEFITAPKAASSGKAEQYVMPSDIEQLRGLKSPVVVRNMDSIACRSLGGMAHWLDCFRVRPCGLRVFPLPAKYGNFGTI